MTTSFRRLVLGLSLVWLWMQTALANVEKTIFLGPETVNVPLVHPTLSDLHIDTLRPSQNASSLRTRLEAEFPTAIPKPRFPNERGKATWLLLDDLTPGQRYEVRVCWAATQPTSFTVNTYELETVWSTPELITSLWEYSISRQPTTAEEDRDQKPRIHRPEKSVMAGVEEKEASLLFLQIVSAADYFTTNATLMANVPPVDVDIILDSFLLNVLPRSLLPTIAYIVVVAVASLFLSRRVLAWIQTLIAAGSSDDDQLLEKKVQ
ncbi:hypothetical protein B0T17DRAFT_485745 [Bombardia bombarda]|uniref:Uncharacterized protein n=1 Tax=Bombardia bombarda TaxID=252184 RepID=A0AA39XIH3_9PEZI|nr:hypothetical protein B0T17DRAFT_485745 [Bombardia bombarda]